MRSENHSAKSGNLGKSFNNRPYHREDVAREIHNMLKSSLAKQKETALRHNRFERLHKELDEKESKFALHMSGLQQGQWVKKVEKTVDWKIKQDGVRHANRSLQLKNDAKSRKLLDDDYRIKKLKERKDAVRQNKEILKKMLAKDFEKIEHGHASEYQMRLKFLTLDDPTVLNAIVNTKKKDPVNDCS